MHGPLLDGVDKHLEATHLLYAVCVEGDLYDVAGGDERHPRRRQLVAAHLDTEVLLEPFNLHVVVYALVRMLHLQGFE